MMINNTRYLRKQLRNRLSNHYQQMEADNIAGLIIEHFLGISGTLQLINQEITVSENTLQQLESALQRLETGEPVQYVLGYSEFYGRRFITDSRGLIPRPETEELVQMVLDDGYTGENNILDIGTGSGCIAITLALETKARVYALDKDPGALELARENAHLLGATVNLLQEDLLKSQPHLPQLDAIVSNPPYVPQSDRESIHQRVKDYEPAGALFVPDQAPLLFYQRIAELAPLYLKPGGRVYLEIYHTAGPAISALFRKPQWSQVIVKKDLHGKDRLVKVTWSPDL